VRFARQFVLCGGDDFEDCSPGSHGNQGEVLLGVTQLVQCPENVIPSFVRVAAPKQRDDFCRQIFAASGHGLKEVSLVFRDGKLDVFDRLTLGGHGTCVPALVQRRPEIVNGVEQNAGQVRWRAPAESDLMQLMSSIVIQIDDVGPCAIVREGDNLPFQVVDVMLCASDSSLSAFEMVNHG
jgi:hypothetical protein